MEDVSYFCSLAVGVACLMSWASRGSPTVQLAGQCRREAVAAAAHTVRLGIGPH